MWNAFDRAVGVLLESNPAHVVLDCRSVSYASSAGLRCFLSLAKRMKTIGGGCLIDVTLIGTVALHDSSAPISRPRNAPFGPRLVWPGTLPWLLAGVLAPYEAYRGWCIERACGLKTPL